MTPVTPKVPCQAGSEIQVMSMRPSLMAANGLMIMPPLVYLPLLIIMRAVLMPAGLYGLSSIES